MLRLTLLMFMALAIIAGCENKSQPVYPGQGPGIQPWRQPALGNDPDAYRRPNFSPRRPCNGPNCPSPN